MLVLTRHRDEDVVIRAADGTEILVRVIDIRSDKVRLGFDAPRDVLIHRAEVMRKVDEDDRVAAEAATDVEDFENAD